MLASKLTTNTFSGLSTKSEKIDHISYAICASVKVPQSQYKSGVWVSTLITGGTTSSEVSHTTAISIHGTRWHFKKEAPEKLAALSWNINLLLVGVKLYCTIGTSGGSKENGKVMNNCSVLHVGWFVAN